MDDTSWLKPAMEIYCDDAQSWVQLAGIAMQRFPKMHDARVKPQLLSMRSTSSFREVVGRAGQVISRRHRGWAAALGA